MSSISITNITYAIYSAVKDKTGDDLNNALSNAVKVLDQKGMLSKSDSILETLQNIIDKDKNIIRAKIYSIDKLSVENIKKIEDELKDRYKAEKIYTTNIEDKNILGGIKIEIADEIIDLSLLKRVTQLKKHLLN